MKGRKEMDEELKKAIEEMAKGMESGFNVVYSKTYNHVYFRARQHMQNDEDAMDLTQIVFVEAYKNIDSLQTPEALFGWLDRITYNQGMKLFRKKRDVLLSEEAEGFFDTIESNDIDILPEISMDQKETSKIIRSIIEELPEAQKVALIAYYFDHFSVGEIAQMEECSEGTIKSRLNYARKYIKDRIEEKEKKEGIRLHSFAPLLLWWAIKFMEGDTTISAQAAQVIYDGACGEVGLRAGLISSGQPTRTAMHGQNGTAGMSATAVNQMGLFGKFAALSTGIKAFIVVGGISLAALAVATTVIVTHRVKEEQFVTESLSEIQEDVETQDNNGIDSTGGMDNAGVEENNERPEAAQVQTGEEVEEEKVNLNPSDPVRTQLGLGILYATEEKDYYDVDLFAKNDKFVHGMRFFLFGYELNNKEYEEGLLPGKLTSNVVTPESVKEFWEDGFGIQVPDDYSYVDEDPGYGISITCDSEIIWESSEDVRTVKDLTIEDNGDGTYLVKGIVVYTLDYDDSDPLVKEIVALCEASGNPDVFGGFRILNITGNAQLEEKADTNAASVNADELANAYYEKAMEIYNLTGTQPFDFDKFYVDDLNSDGIPEFLMTDPDMNSTGWFRIIFSYDGTSVNEIARIEDGNVIRLFGHRNDDGITYEFFHMGDDIAYSVNIHDGSSKEVFNYHFSEDEIAALQETESFGPIYTPAADEYEMQYFEGLSVDKIKAEISRYK